MGDSAQASTANDLKPGEIPRRDLLLLPLLSLLTVVFLLVGSEVTARVLFPQTGAKACEVADGVIGRRFKPFCTARMKSAEGPWVVNQYNDCGYRTRESCANRPPGTARIALLGSSVSEGLFVPFPETFGERVAQGVAARCRRPVQVQNMGREACDPVCTFHRIDETLTLKPDLVLLALTPHDVDDLSAAKVAGRYQPIAPNVDAQGERPGLYYKLRSMVLNSRAATVVQHLLFRDAATYLRLYLPYRSHTGYLTRPLSPEWESHLQALDTLLGEEAKRFHEANVPFVVVDVPSLAQASIVSLRTPPSGLDPDAFDEAVGEIAARHGIQFVRVLDRFRRTPDANHFFYVVDGHLSGDGQQLVSGPLVDQLTRGPNATALGCRAGADPAADGARLTAAAR